MTTTPFARAPGRPRDPARIDIVLAALRAYWTANPDLRLGQIVVNAASGGDPFSVEDEVLMGAWPVFPETPASDLAGLAARGQATQPAPHAPRTCWTCRSACADGSGCSYVGVMEVARRRWCSAAGNLDPDTELPLPGAAPCPAFVGRA